MKIGCTVFVPKHPIINPNINSCIEMEKNIDYESIIKDIIINIETISITENEKIEFEELL